MTGKDSETCYELDSDQEFYKSDVSNWIILSCVVQGFKLPRHSAKSLVIVGPLKYVWFMDMIQVHEEKAGSYLVGILTLNHPKALNALNLEMLKKIKAQLRQWAAQPEVAMVVIHSALDRAFCAGGDVKAIVQSSLKDQASSGEHYFAEEYTTDFLIHQFSKPILAWGHGIVMGGGLGLMNGASHRVVTNHTIMAMPEISIGFFPDVGASYFLSRVPERLGLFAAITGARLSGADALYMGLADYFFPATSKDHIVRGLAGLPWSDQESENHQLLTQYLSALTEQRDESRIEEFSGEIDAWLESEDAVEVDMALRSAEVDDDWLKQTLSIYKKGSPLSIAVIHEQIRRGSNLSLEQAFAMELEMAKVFSHKPDFHEGVRAVLIDKDQKPQWSKASVSEVGKEDVLGFFPSVSETSKALFSKPQF